MNKKDISIIKDIVNDCIRGTLAVGQAKKFANYYIEDVPVVYQFEYYPLANRTNHNNNLIHQYIRCLRGNQSVLDVRRREAIDAAVNFFSYTLMKIYGRHLDSISNLCLFPIPTQKDEGSHYAEWCEIADRIESRTNAINCIDAFDYHYKNTEFGTKWSERDGLPDGSFNQAWFETTQSTTANVILLTDQIHRGTQVQQTIDALRDMGNDVIIVMSLSQVVI